MVCLLRVGVHTGYRRVLGVRASLWPSVGLSILSAGLESQPTVLDRISERVDSSFLQTRAVFIFKLRESRCVNCRWILGRPDPVASVRFRHPRDPGKGSAVARPHHDSGQGGYLKAVRRRNPRRDGGRPPRARNPRRMSKVNSFRLKDPCSPLL